MEEASLLLDLICLKGLLASGLLISGSKGTSLSVKMIVSEDLDSSKVLDDKATRAFACSTT